MTNKSMGNVPRWQDQYEAMPMFSPEKHMQTEIDQLRALLYAPVVENKTVPAFKFETLVEHCKRLEKDIAQARAHVNEITLYQQNAVWFWQHDGEDYLQSLACPIIIQPHHLRELLDGKAQHNPLDEKTEPVAIRVGDLEPAQRLALALGEPEPVEEEVYYPHDHKDTHSLCKKCNAPWGVVYSCVASGTTGKARDV